jgi:acetylglutamate/LysW-gamma-L-alpha-aminoadipate kinase
MTMLMVVKCGGRILEMGVPDQIIEDVKRATSSGRLVFVHGGGVMVTEIASKLGKEQRFITSPDGFRSRYTDRETAEIYTMVMAGKLNKQIVSRLQVGGVPAVGLSGLDGCLIRARRKKRLVIVDERGRNRVIDGGYTGKIVEVNSSLLHLLLDAGYVPVVSPVAAGEGFEALNVDGDRTAAHVAGAVNADRLVLLTDVEGLMLDDTLVRRLTALEAKDALGSIGPGMITKVYAAMEALEMGVEEVIITCGRSDAPISSAIGHEKGTVISRV